MLPFGWISKKERRRLVGTEFGRSAGASASTDAAYYDLHPNHLQLTTEEPKGFA